MSNNINPIKFGIAGNQYFKQDSKDDLAKTAEKNNQGQVSEKKQMKSDDVLGFMAAQNAAFVPAQATRTIKVSNYVTAEQEERIADFMKGFEADYEEASKVALNEFPDISEGAANNIALAYINAKY